MKRRILMGMILFSSLSFSQNFNYETSVSTSSYQNLSEPVNLGNGEDWNGKEFTIPAGFSFPFLGFSYDSLTVSSNGTLSFGKTRYSIMAFSSFTCKKDTTMSILHWATVSMEIPAVGF